MVKLVSWYVILLQFQDPVDNVKWWLSLFCCHSPSWLRHFPCRNSWQSQFCNSPLTFDSTLLTSLRISSSLTLSKCWPLHLPSTAIALSLTVQLLPTSQDCSHLCLLELQMRVSNFWLEISQLSHSQHVQSQTYQFPFQSDLISLFTVFICPEAPRPESWLSRLILLFLQFPHSTHLRVLCFPSLQWSPFPSIAYTPAFLSGQAYCNNHLIGLLKSILCPPGPRLFLMLNSDHVIPLLKALQWP